MRARRVGRGRGGSSTELLGADQDRNLRELDLVADAVACVLRHNGDGAWPSRCWSDGSGASDGEIPGLFPMAALMSGWAGGSSLGLHREGGGAADAWVETRWTGPIAAVADSGAGRCRVAAGVVTGIGLAPLVLRLVSAPPTVDWWWRCSSAWLRHWCSRSPQPRCPACAVPPASPSCAWKTGQLTTTVATGGPAAQ